MNDDENKLIEASTNGDPQAFKQLLESHYDFIFSVSYKFCRNQASAEDLAHDVCIKISDKISKFKFKSSFQTWLYQLILNAFRDLYRKNKRNINHLEIDSLELENEEISENDKILARQVYQKSLLLPEKLRDSFLLVYVNDLNHLEASEILNCSEKTISWRVFEARKRIREMMEEL